MTETTQGGAPTGSLVPRGVTVTGLASVHWRTGDGNPLGQIQHAHDDWYANTVRLQVGVPLLRGKSTATSSWNGGGPTAALTGYLATAANGMTAERNGCHYNADFLGYLDQAVGLAQQLNLVYAIHHPVGARTAANWATQFGYLAGLGIPVVVGEWTNWATRNAECWPDAASTVPAFLSYVSGLGGCGLIAWALLPKVLVVDQKQWAPTQILASYTCDGSVSGQGAGQLIQQRFAAWAGQPQPGATVQG